MTGADVTSCCGYFLVAGEDYSLPKRWRCS